MKILDPVIKKISIRILFQQLEGIYFSAEEKPEYWQFSLLLKNKSNLQRKNEANVSPATVIDNHMASILLMEGE